ncbi:MAG: hypothetical protein WA117_24600 [Verrucomicrobiia bacterium]
MIEKHDRSFTRTGLWQIAGTLDTCVTSLPIVNGIKPIVVIGFIELFIKICLDYLHERIRERIPFGRMKSEEYFV